MAKKSNNNSNNNSKSKKPRSRNARKRSGNGGNAVQQNVKYAQLLDDPCNGPTDLGHRFSGEIGFVQRFVSDGVLNVPATHTAGLVLFHPNSGTVLAYSITSSSTTQPIAISSFVTNGALPGPGAAYLTGAADKVRAYAACVQAFPSAVSITNLTGEYAVGVISLSACFGTYSVDNFFTMLAGRGAMMKRKTEIKWFPGAMDNKYSIYNSVASSVDSSDTNVIALAYRGYPAATALSIRCTNVVEWCPRPAVGIAPTQQTAPELKHNDVVAALHRSRPSWLHNLGESFGHAAGNFVGGLTEDIGKVARYGARRAMSYGVASLENAIGSGLMLTL